MESKYSSETASVSTNWIWTVCVIISGMLLYWKSSLLRKFRALLGRPQSSDLSCVGHPDSSLSQENSKRSCRQVYKYDVFLSFRGTDTRNTFTDHLYNNLTRKGIFTFMDDKRLEQGQPISSQLLQAIKDSRVLIIVFSRGYASSTWCLEEMAAIAECKEQTIFSIFHDVDPSDVRKQSGEYKDAFILHTEKFKEEDPGKVDRWKKAMTNLANSVGWDVRHKPEYMEIDKIIQKVIKTLKHKFSDFANDLIGIQPRVKELEKVLQLSSIGDNFRVLGICGMGGVGKTTHATALYDTISYQFDACCFIENVSKEYRDGGAIAVQKQILRQTLGEQNREMCSPCEISCTIRHRLSPIKVLIVLDNVDEVEQWQKLNISPNLLGNGSRIIIITRNEHILKVCGADEVYKVPLLNYYDAHELFLRKAFNPANPSTSGHVELIPKILEYAQSLPLAIQVLGSHLYARDATQWKDALEILRENPDKRIMDVLQISFDGLHNEEKEIFLHIACFFRGERQEYVNRILKGCGLHPDMGIQALMEKSLITIRNQEIHMHEMVQELGKKIVRKESSEEPKFWSGLWLYQDFHDVLTSEMETSKVKAIVLDQKEDVPEAFN